MMHITSHILLTMKVYTCHVNDKAALQFTIKEYTCHVNDKAAL